MRDIITQHTKSKLKKNTTDNVTVQQNGKCDAIVVKNARVNNLKGVDVAIPRNRLTVITGLSGSGKSSLAFDTLYAEGQRRYVESLSAYARQFLGRMQKPECDAILGLPPAIAIEQKVNTRNPRSTVGTSTEIYDYIRLLFGRVGHTYSPVSGVEVKRHTVADVTAAVAQMPPGTRLVVAAPLVMPAGRKFATHLDVIQKAGYTRLIYMDEPVLIDDILATPGAYPENTDDYLLVVDRLTAGDDPDDVSRLAESAETAFFEGNSTMVLLQYGQDRSSLPVRHVFSSAFEADGMTFVQPSEQMFNFNSPFGACPRCEGFGRTLGIDEDLVIPNPALSVYDDAVLCWRGEKMSEYKRAFVAEAAKAGFPVHRPVQDLDDRQRRMLRDGIGSAPGINGFFEWVETQQHKIQYRVMLARYRGKTVCPVCNGSRLRKDAAYVRVGAKTVHQLTSMPVGDLRKWFDGLKLPENEAMVAARLLTEIKNRLRYLDEVGLDYLTLDRPSNTLSGGESQRINLATSLGSSLVGSLYILDEPSIGLHPRDTHRLIGVLKGLQHLGNTVVVVEHDEDIMRAADNIVDVGPEAGTGGGTIVYQGPVDGVGGVQGSHTAAFLDGSDVIAVPKRRRKSSSYIQLNGCRQHNLKNMTVRFPLGVLTVVSGVSGSGKSTLVRDILYKALVRQLGEAGDAPGRFDGMTGDVARIHDVQFVDQNPIGKSSRSNAATYTKAYDEIRRLFAEQQLSRQMGFAPSHFSFNTDGGRCEECKGDGTITIQMQFMSDITVVCESCHGQRFKPEVLEVMYRGKNITDILRMTVDSAVKFFEEDPGVTAQRVAARLRPLQNVGLGYITLGQTSATLSGGENQRLKLACYLGEDTKDRTLFIFDEPTTGLHPHDVRTLLAALQQLVDRGHTVVLIEHNLDVLASVDHLIDIGPEGGDAGGTLVAAGTPEQVAAGDGHTARFLRRKLGMG